MKENKFKVGDKVRRINIAHGGCLVGAEATVTEVPGHASICIDGHPYAYANDNFELVTPTWTPTKGEMVEVKNKSSTVWHKRMFLTMDGGKFVCHEHDNYFYAWAECRPIQHTITIDGVEVKLSHESFLALKAELLKGDSDD